MKNNGVNRGLFWFRRDLRLEDNTALFYALTECDFVAPIFVFDKDILDVLPSYDRRVEFIWENINFIKENLRLIGSDLIVVYGNGVVEIPKLANKYNVSTVYANEDYEPFGIDRDLVVKKDLSTKGIAFKLYKDTVIFEKNEILKFTNQPFTVFTQYKNEWKKKLNVNDYSIKDSESVLHKMVKFKSVDMPTLESLGFERTNLGNMSIGIGNVGAKKLLEIFKKRLIFEYKNNRDIPFINGVSFLSVHNRFGSISIRRLVAESVKVILSVSLDKKENCETWLSELIWRDFYMQLLFHYPTIIKEPFKKEFINYPWENKKDYFDAWSLGKTGYPIIDAAMTQLNTTGYMHNRLRMVVASFLTKDLLTDYRFGEAYFATHLLDYDLSANNGGWQWSASTGCDTQEYFRIFNPIKQSLKFDKDAKYIKKYLPIFKDVPSDYLHEPWKYQNELQKLGVVLGEDYPLPIVVHEDQRKIILDIYNKKMT